MERHYDKEAIRRDLTEAILGALRRHGVGDVCQPLAVCSVLEVIASPLKSCMNATPLTRRMGFLGVDCYVASRLAQRVELLKSPHSVIVNPMMDAIAAALVKGAVSDGLLLRNALRIHLGDPALTKASMAAALRSSAGLEAAFQSARGYVLEGEVIARTEDGKGWCLADPWIAT